TVRSGRGDIADDEVAVAVREIPGEWSDWSPFGDTTRRCLRGKREYICVREFAFPQGSNLIDFPGLTCNPGDVFFEDIVIRYELNRDRVDHDFCRYCGTDNGPNGAYRLGYDCCHCGGS